MELFKPVVTVYSFQQLWGCGDEHRASVSDTDRSHTAPKEMPKCYKDEPYGQPQHSRPLIGIFKQLWLMGQLLQVWDQWKCNLIFWTQVLNFFVPFFFFFCRESHKTISVQTKAVWDTSCGFVMHFPFAPPFLYPVCSFTCSWFWVFLHDFYRHFKVRFF